MNQAPIRKPEVEKYVKRIKRVLKRANAEKVETYLRETASLLTECVSAFMDTSPNGTWAALRKQRTASEMLRVLAAVDPIRSGLTVAALFLMREQEPRRFVDDQAWRFQLVRCWRSQTRLAYGAYWNQKTNAVKTTYKPLPPRVIEAIAPLLIEAYSGFASYVIAADKRTLTMRQTLAEGFAPLLADQEVHQMAKPKPSFDSPRTVESTRKTLQSMVPPTKDLNSTV